MTHTGASRSEQVVENTTASELPRLSDDVHREVTELYRDAVHAQVRGAY